MSSKSEEGYLSLIENTQRLQYPGFVNSLLSGPLAEDGRAAVIEFRDGLKPSVKELKTSRALRRYLEQAPPDDVPVRRAFVLEGLPKTSIQILGSKLRVPPSFFAAHWAGHGRYLGNMLNRAPRSYAAENRFLLRFPRLHQAKIKAVEGDETDIVYRMGSRADRPLSHTSLFGDLKGPLASLEQLSFWGLAKGQGWDALILVDPPLGNFVAVNGSSVPRDVERTSTIDLEGVVETVLSQDGSWFASYVPDDALSEDEADWKEPHRQAGMQCFFDDIAQLYPMTSHPSLDAPKHSTGICRQLALSAWTANIRVFEAQVIKEQYELSIPESEDKFRASTWLNKAWTKPYKPRQFGRLIRAKSALESVDADLYHNMAALGIGSKSPTVGEWEADAWKSLQQAIQALKARVELIIQAYTQAASIQETVIANNQARSVGYLTSLATVFIPASFIAAVFSMGGDFSAGERLFWVFWAISVPIVLIAGVFLFTNFGRWIMGHTVKEENPV